MGNTPNSKHQNGRDRPKKNVHWKSAEHPSAPGKPMLVTAFDAPPDVVTLKWDRPRSDGGSPVIGFLVEHRRTGSPNWTKATTALVPYPEMSITGLEPGWRYQFRVSAQNVIGLSEPSEVSEPLTVTLQRNAITLPRFLNELQDTVALENEQCEFIVNVAGTPAPQINWFKDGFEIFSSRRTKIINENGKNTLIIHQTALTDEGEIKCTAANRAGHAVTRAILKLEAQPRIRLPRQYEDGLLVEAGETMRLKVGIAGRPTPTITWSHNGETIRNGPRIDLLTNEKNSFLKISHTTRADRGEYQLRAVNKLGEFSTSFLVTVTAKPSPPGQVKIAMTLGKSVTLSWTEPDDDGGCKIGNYIVEYFRIEWNVWLKAAATRQLNATLNDLIEGSEYRFRVKAESPYGLSEPSEESNVLFVPDHKRGILKPSNEHTNLEMEIKANISSKRSPRSINSKIAFIDKVKPTKVDKAQETVGRIQIAGVPKNVKIIPQLLDNESLSKALNYGTKVDTIYKKSEQTIPKTKVIEAATKNALQHKLITDNNAKAKLNEYPNKIQNIPNISSPKLDQKSAVSSVHNLTTNELHQEQMKRSPPVENKRYSLQTPRDNNDEVHTSSEFVLVLYDEENTGNERNSNDQNFDLELHESIMPPPLSLSAPDLRSDLPISPILRRSASSTELLYEKAMQKFYEAVKIEEAQNEFRRSMSAGPKSGSRAQSPEHRLVKQKSHSFDETGAKNRRKTSLTKFDSLDENGGKRGENDSGSDTYESDYWDDDENDDSEFERDIKKEIMESQRKPIVNLVFEDDYTESTVSTASVSAATSLDSIDQFINNVQNSSNNNIKSIDDELETYHPPMEQRALSPYRSPEPGQAAIILTRPLSLPDPDYIPKPILKRPSNENSEKETAHSPKPNNKSEKKSLLHLFGKKAPSDDNLKSSRDDLGSASSRGKVKTTGADVEREKVATLRRQVSEEENKVVINHYSDLVRELGGTGRAKVPIYMSGQAETEWRDEEKDDQIHSDTSEVFSDKSQSIKSVASDENKIDLRNMRPKITKQKVIKPIDRNEIVETDIKRDLVRTNPSMERLASPTRGDLVEISVEHTQSISYALREIKQDSVSGDDASSKAPLKKSIEMRESRSATGGAIPKRKPTSASNSRSNSVTRAQPKQDDRQTNAPPAPAQKRALSRTRTATRSASKSPASQTRTSLTSTVLKVTRLPLNENYENIAINLSPTISPSISPTPSCRTPEQILEEAEVKVKSSMSYATDVAMFLLASWLYLFKDARLAIPILALMVYRQIKSVFKDKYSNWTQRKKS